MWSAVKIHFFGTQMKVIFSVFVRPNPYRYWLKSPQGFSDFRISG